MTEALATYDAVSALATGGTFQANIDARDLAADKFHILLMQVRFHYCANTSMLDQTPELARIGFQPRRDPGAAAPAPLPAQPPMPTWTGAARTLGIPALPEHTTSLSAFMEIPGGTPILILEGEDGETTLTIPATVTIPTGTALRLAGVNSRGIGPASPRTNA